MPVSAAVRVTGDIVIRPSFVRVNHPADHLTYAINLAPVDEGYVHMYRTTSAQGGYIPFTITPDTGREVESVRIITFSGEDVSVRSWGEVAGYDGPLYTFIMPEDSVTILVTFKNAESAVQ